MLRIFSISLGLCLYSFLAYSQSVTITKENNSQYHYSFANITFNIDTAHGARVISLKLKGNEVLNQSPMFTMNGSTFWPAPQSVWNWPPIGAIDNKPYSIQISKDTLLLESKIDVKYHLSVVKKYYVSRSDTSVHIVYYLKNNGSESASWAPWEITRVPANGLTFFSKGDTTVWGNMASVAEFLNGCYWYSQSLLTSASSNKKFFGDGKGWLAHVNSQNMLFIKKFEDIRTKTAAAGESEVEIYTGENLSYTEIENQGKLSVIKPGDSVSYHVQWFLKELPATIVANKGNTQLVKYVQHVIGTRKK